MLLVALHTRGRSVIKHVITAKKVLTAEEFYSLREIWNTLLETSPTNSYFLTWEWLWSWWDAYKEDTLQLYIITIFRGDSLIGIAPLYVNNNGKSGPFSVRRLMFLGIKENAAQSEYMNIIMNDAYAKEIVEELVHFLSKEKAFDDILLRMMDESSTAISFLRSAIEKEDYLYHVQGRLECPFIKLPAVYDDFLGKVSSRIRHTIRNSHKKIQKKYASVSYRKAGSEAELENDFTELARLHQLRWKSRDLPGSFSRNNYIVFHKSIMKEMIKRGNLELWFLSVDGKAIAALYNIKYNGKCYNYQAGIDVDFDPSIAPGILLHNHCISEAISTGLQEYDFLAMGKRDAYKKSWTDSSHHLVDLYMVRPGFYKFLAASLIKLKLYYHLVRSITKRSNAERMAL